MQVFLESKRLILRRFAGDDANNLFDLDGDPEVMRFLTGGEPAPRTVIENETMTRFLQYYERFEGFGYWAAVEKSTGRFLGWFEFRPREGRDPDEVELGYRLRRSPGPRATPPKGHAPLIRKSFTELGVRRMVAQKMTVNIASRRVMEKSGLSPTRVFHQWWPGAIAGTRPGEIEYALPKADWKRQEEYGREPSAGHASPSEKK